MTFIDVSPLLQPVRPESPCGSDLEYSPAYLEAARALEGRPDVQYGSMHLAATEPDWRHVKAATLELMAESRDLRLAVWLTRAIVSLHGAAAIADGLALIEGLISRYWDDVHPQLDADDDRDPTARLNTLLALDDKAGFLRELRSAPLIASPRHGRVGLGDIERAAGEAGEDAPALDRAAIDATFADAEIEDVTAVDDALAHAVSSLERIDAQLNERIGHQRSVSLKALEQALSRASRAVHSQRERHPALAVHARDALAPAAPAAVAAAAAIPPDRIACRDDVICLLDRLCDYYARAEPSSPVPILLHRARKLVGMRFGELVADLAPAGSDQVAHWAGSAEQ
ncbi:MAG: type VI secretion system protein TssA [Trinickia sp.]